MTSLRIAIAMICGGLMIYNVTGFVLEHIDAWLERRRSTREIRLSTKCPRPDRSARR